MGKLIKKVKLRRQRSELLLGIPTAMVQLMGFSDSDKVKVTYENGKIVIERLEEGV